MLLRNDGAHGVTRPTGDIRPSTRRARSDAPYRGPSDSFVRHADLGDVALFFHPGGLYRVYGLTLRRDSTFRDTLVVGYVDDLIGYVPDPKAYDGRPEYSAVVVPKIMSLPCYQPEVGRALNASKWDLLRKLK